MRPPGWGGIFRTAANFFLKSPALPGSYAGQRTQRRIIFYMNERAYFNHSVLCPTYPVGKPRTCTSKRRYLDVHFGPVQFGRSYNVRRTSFSVRPEDVLPKTSLRRLLFVLFSRSAQKTSTRRPFCTCSERTLLNVIWTFSTGTFLTFDYFRRL